MNIYPSGLIATLQIQIHIENFTSLKLLQFFQFFSLSFKKKIDWNLVWNSKLQPNKSNHLEAKKEIEEIPITFGKVLY